MGVNRFRDYRLTLKVQSPAYGREAGWEAAFAAAPPLATGRVHDFYDGIYEQFLVEGPAELTIQLHKGDSISTVISAVFLDPWSNGERVADVLLDPRSSELAVLGQRRREPLGRMASAYRRLLALKTEDPAAFIEQLPALAGGLGEQSARQPDEPADAWADRLYLLVAAFEEVLEYTARDHQWALCGQALAEWIREAPEPELRLRRATVEARLRNAHQQRWVTGVQIERWHRAYYEVLLGRKDLADAGDEVAVAARRDAVGRPHAALGAVLALATTRHGLPAAAATLPDDMLRELAERPLYAWAHANAQLGNYDTAVTAVEEFLARFPNATRAPHLQKRLPALRSGAARYETLRNATYEVGPVPERPQ